MRINYVVLVFFFQIKNKFFKVFFSHFFFSSWTMYRYPPRMYIKSTFIIKNCLIIKKDLPVSAGLGGKLAFPPALLELACKHDSFLFPFWSYSFSLCFRIKTFIWTAPTDYKEKIYHYRRKRRCPILARFILQNLAN